MDETKLNSLLAAGINVPAALERFMNREAMLDKYLGRFLNEKSYAALMSAMASNDQEQAKAAVHTLKSVCGTIGCEAMQAQALELEQAMRADKWDEARAMMPAIESAYDSICDALRNLGYA